MLIMIYKEGRENRRANSFMLNTEGQSAIPDHLMRKTPPYFPGVSELETVRHFTRLSRKNFSIDTNFYPLGSCTMKYNPRIAHELAMLPGYLNHHPYSDEADSQGLLKCLFELQAMLVAVTGMRKISLAPMAGAQGEFVGVSMMKAYHRAQNDENRTEIIVPDAAHGTNPASAAKCGFTVRELPTGKNGDIDLDALKKMVGPQTAGIMLTNPSTLGVFDRQIKKVADIIHQVGGLLYYDGANLNAILGQCRPGDMGFDVIHLNLHKTFATPHGGGGPGSGPVAAGPRLAEFLPIPMVGCENDHYFWLNKNDCPNSIGRLSTFHGNFGVLLRAFIYSRMLGREGMKRVSQFATLNANYLMKRLEGIGYTLAYPERRASHEFIITAKPLTKAYGVTALDIAKRLLDYGFHAPTVYFPLLIPECLLIEPTETESKQELDRFLDAMAAIYREAQAQPELLKNAPQQCPVGRLDEVKAARELDLRYRNIKRCPELVSED
jgi:glycine dehydrogenase subunit 2